MTETTTATETAPSPKRPIIFYVCSGLAAGILVFRFGFMPFAWHSGFAKILEIASPILVFSSWQIAKLQKRTGWSFKTFIVFWIPALLTGLGLCLALTPNPANASLVRRELPGFSVDLPVGTISFENLDYANGKLDLKDAANSPLTLNIAWEPGGALDEETQQLIIQMLSGAMQGKLARPMEYWPGPQQAEIPSLTFTTPRGPAYISLLLCGGRRISVISLGHPGAEILQKKILLTVNCHPDWQSEVTLNSVPWTIKSETWKKLSDAPAGQVQFSDGTNVIIVRNLTGITGDRDHFKGSMKALFNNDTIALEFGEWIGDYLKLKGTVQGNATVGWVRRLQCGKASVLILALAPDESGAQHSMQASDKSGACSPQS
jgi:hypothetical protein